MEIKIRELITNQEVLNSARTTVWREDLMKEPTKQFMKDIYMAEHSPIRCKMFMIDYHGIKRWIADHLVRHNVGVTPFMSTQREDRNEEIMAISIEDNDEVSNPRDEAKQGSLVNLKLLVNAQALINISRKRLCGQAHVETQQVWNKTVRKLKEVDEELAFCCVPECIYRGGMCPEKNCCGRNSGNNFGRKLRLYQQNRPIYKEEYRNLKYNGETFKNYKINEFGDIIGDRGFLKSSKDKDGYLHVTIKREDGSQFNATVHRCVACTFIPNTRNLSMINHINNQRDDNWVGNLEWVSAKENIEHAVKQDRMFKPKGSKNNNAKLNEENVLDIKKQLKQGVPIKNICQQYEVAYQTIADIRDGRSWKHVILED